MTGVAQLVVLDCPTRTPQLSLIKCLVELVTGVLLLLGTVHGMGGGKIGNRGIATVNA